MIKHSDKLENIGRPNDLVKAGLKKLHLDTVEDLLRYFPVRYLDIAGVQSIGNVSKGEKVTLFGKIESLETGKSFRSKITMAKGVLTDGHASLDLVWFNQPYIAKMIQDGSMVRVEGTITERNNKLYISNPAIESVAYAPFPSNSLFKNKVEPDSELGIYPVYPETRFISSRWIYHHLQKIFTSGALDDIFDPIPEEILKKYHLPSLKTAYVWIHTPKNKNDAEAARKRFAFEEVFFIQLARQKERMELRHLPAAAIKNTKKDIDSFLSRLPFTLTNGQQKAIDDILSDIEKGAPMSRLLEGDVGSGKTAVAAATAFAVTNNRPYTGKKGDEFGNFQIAIMAPTEILAAQHFESFISLFKHLPVSIALMTGSGCRKFPSKVNPNGSTPISRPQLLKWVKNGEISIVVGTHALIAKSVEFKNLAYVVIDEQHRFGVAQRKALVRKHTLIPHLLSMTATPIPRTLALTIYGDLDLSVLDEMPAGRKKVITDIVLPSGRKDVYEKMREELKSGRQAYVICPRINEPDPDKEVKLNVKSVKEEAKRLKEKVFPEYQIEIIHSKQSSKEKDRVMKDFSEGKIDILVSTSVVEVGVNVPNATVILIEGAERFGLSQLHQLRGRVIRSNHQAYCFVFADAKSDTTIERLRAFKTAKNGFELAELDLKLRGAGELSGDKQWGISDLAMEALKNLKMVEAAREEAKRIIEKDPELKNNPIFLKEITKNSYHFE